MCGIAGVLHLDGSPVEAAVVEAMGEAVRHRGPDGHGALTEGPVGLAHRRLAILDLTDAARQPMRTADGRFALVYNGEVYNFAELRAPLERGGVAFRSRGDAEVVLQALATWGEEALLRLNGMFALAFWDAREGTLLLARDRFGVKPLYYARVGPRLLFGSEVKALLAHPGLVAAVDLAGLREYLAFQNFFTDRTLFEGVRLLPAGCRLRVGRDDGGRGAEPGVRRYWDFSFREAAAPGSREELLEELHRLFVQAVERQLVSDVEVGAYLSGGMDSGSITAVAATRLPWMRTFTAGFDLTSASGIELGFDERPAAERMSYLFRTEHYEMVLKSGDMERVMPELTWHLEEPRVGQSYPNFYVARLASRFCKVALSGTGGDELFGGYPWRYYRGAVNGGFDDYVEQYFGFWQRLLPAGTEAAVLAPVWSRVSHVEPREVFKGVFAGHAAPLERPEDYINRSMYLEAKTFLHSLLVVEDKLSMAHGLETRVPFLDNDLVDFAQRLPVRFKLGNLGEVLRLNENLPGSKTAAWFSRTRDGKLLLREAMARWLPAEVTERAKQGFSGPDASWFKGESIEYVKRVLLDDRARLWELLDRRAVRELVADHLEGRENRRLLIWSLLFLEQWCRRFL
jgi:asparagine synthase (glutamine-hydrolysing)